MMADVRSTTATASIADTRYSDHDDGADSGLSTVSESTPFLTDHRRPPSAELQTAPSGAQLTDSQRALVTSHQGHDDGGGDQFRISCLSYYDPYHDTSYAAHYLIPLKPLLAGCRPEDVGHVQNPGIPAVVPGAINVSRSPERANGGSGTARSRPSSDLLLGGHFNVYAEPPSLERSASATQIRNATSPSNRDDWLARASREPFYGQEATNEARASSSTCPPNDLSCSGMLSRDPLVAVIQRTLTPNWRVDYVDFTPELSGFETGNISCGESFPDLVKKVNYWLCQNPQIEAKTCEMITWSTPHVSRVGDSESMIQEQHNQFMIINDTYYVMGLRVWIVPQTGTGATQIINYRDFKPEDNESLSELLEKTNSSLDDDTLQGHVLCFETVMLPNFRSSDTNSLFWRENENVSRGFTAFLRLFYVEGPKTCYRLGIRNIVPDVIQGNYEPFSCLMRRASQWVSSEPSVKVTNLRSTYVTRDNDSPSQAADRCDQYFRDFAKEQYFQIIRIYHVSSPSFSTTKHVINCMTFTPVQSSIGPSTEATFETMKSTMLRIDAWIRLSGAKIFSLESLITPMIPTQPNHTLPEMTHWLPKRAATTDNGRKKFLLHIRIYIDGEFIDPDPRLLPPLPYSLTKQLESSLEEKELKRFYKKKKMRKTQNRIAIAMFMFILVTVALVIIIERMLKRYYR